MNQSTRVRSQSMFVLAAMALVPLAATMGACGHGKPPETPASESESSSASSAASEAPDGEAEPAASAAASAAPSEGSSSESSAAAPSNPGSTKATSKNDSSWVACHSNFKPKGKSQAADVAALATGCAKTTKMKKIKAAASKTGDAQTWPLKTKANKCYRVYVQGADGTKIDASIKDSTGAVAGAASGDSSTAVVLDDGAVCFKEADAATVSVSVKSGSGGYAVQIWGD